VQHLDRVGVLAGVLNVLSEADINVKEMQNTIFGDTGSAVATITLGTEPGLAVLNTVKSNCDHLLGLQWIPTQADETE
jgi:D-3-phosphoglycerate dehydrogenase